MRKLMKITVMGMMKRQMKIMRQKKVMMMMKKMKTMRKMMRKLHYKRGEQSNGRKSQLRRVQM